ncbi:MAG: type II toxin-antitoxin system RelE/ParE family toxin [bacterium]
MEVRFLDVAQQELDETVEYYNIESQGLGDQFLLEVLSSLERIKQFAQAWRPFTKNSRRCQTRRFSYGITYQILESENTDCRTRAPAQETWLLVGQDQ